MKTAVSLIKASPGYGPAQLVNWLARVRSARVCSCGQTPTNLNQSWLFAPRFKGCHLFQQGFIALTIKATGIRSTVLWNGHGHRSQA